MLTYTATKRHTFGSLAVPLTCVQLCDSVTLGMVVRCRNISSIDARQKSGLAEEVRFVFVNDDMLL